VKRAIGTLKTKPWWGSLISAVVVFGAYLAGLVVAGDLGGEDVLFGAIPFTLGWVLGVYLWDLKDDQDRPTAES
jgi:hypothetical protein